MGWGASQRLPVYRRCGAWRPTAGSNANSRLAAAWLMLECVQPSKMAAFRAPGCGGRSQGRASGTGTPWRLPLQQHSAGQGLTLVPGQVLAHAALPRSGEIRTPLHSISPLPMDERRIIAHRQVTRHPRASQQTAGSSMFGLPPVDVALHGAKRAAGERDCRSFPECKSPQHAGCNAGPCLYLSPATAGGRGVTFAQMYCLSRLQGDAGD